MLSLSLPFVRYLMVLLSLVLSNAYFVSITGWQLSSALWGCCSGILFAGLLIAAEKLWHRCNLRTFNLLVVGLLLGVLLGHGITSLIDAILAPAQLEAQSLGFAHLAIYLFSTYIAVTLVMRASEELYLSIPFVRLKSSTMQHKDIVLDASVLADSRIIDLASSGLLDQRLVVARFLLKEFHDQCDVADENIKNKARRSLEVIKKLEAMPSLGLRYSETDFPEIKDSHSKLVRLARFLDSHLITADINRVQQSSFDGVRIINIHVLSNSLKPLMQSGEILEIKINRTGKEPRQGVGYLEDGTMVVVNGGGDFIGEVIKAQVLSVKHTSSGRMIFSNAMQEIGRLEQQISSHLAQPDRNERMRVEREYTTSASGSGTGSGSHRDYFLV